MVNPGDDSVYASIVEGADQYMVIKLTIKPGVDPENARDKAMTFVKKLVLSIAPVAPYLKSYVGKSHIKYRVRENKVLIFI